MINREKVVNFLLKFKKVFVFGGALALAIAIIAIVAVNTSNNKNFTGENPVSTSTPSAVEFVMPVENGEIIKDYSNTALKYNATLKQWESHKAIDIKANDDANVVACYDGEVIDVSTTYLKGTVVTIKHNKTLQTVYGSLDENVLVKAGDKVSKGQIIGKVSSTAKNESADGNHLHFEVLQNGVKVDPNLYLVTSDK